MRLASLVALFRTPSVASAPGGHMALADHLRELRARVLRAVVALVAGTVVAFVFYDVTFDLVWGPYEDAQRLLGESVETKGYIQGAAGPLLLRLKLSGVVGIVATSPYWLYQLWAFIMPGLHANERRWSRIFAAVAGPLFIAGVAVGYYVLPRGLEVLIGFTPANLENLVEFGEYFSFFTRMLLVFGVSFEIPLFVILLSLAGVVSGRWLGEHRPWIIVGTFVFAAAATPSTDPFSMLMLALPMTVLFIISEIIARLLDRRRRAAALAGGDDDEASDISDYLAHDPEDDRASAIDDE